MTLWGKIFKKRIRIIR